MKVILNYLFITAFAVSVALTSCKNVDDDEDNRKFTVTFNSNGGSEVPVQIVTEGNKVDAPDEPTKENCEFNGWYKDNNTFVNAWDFENETVTADISLYAKWLALPFELGALQKILDGYVMNAIAFDSKGNDWIGTRGQGLIRYNDRETEIYNSENSVFPEDFTIYDIAVDKNDNVWIGGNKGLWKYDGEEFTFYDSRNTAMPKDIVWSIAVDSQNNIWLASCTFRQGGLVKYDGTEWTTYTPDNSALPTNSIHGITIDSSDNVWLALGDYVNQAYLVKISNDKWDVYGEEELGFKPYYLGGIQCDSKNRLWGAINYSMSSAWPHPSPHFFIFDGEKTIPLSCGDDAHIGGLPKITIDHNDNVWCFGVASMCGVWIDEQWMQFDRSEFGGSGVLVIKEDPDHRMWIGTWNGIYKRIK